MRLRLRVPAIVLLLALTSATARADWPHSPGSSALLAGANGDQNAAVVASDGEEGAFVAWEDQRSGLTRVYVQRLDRWGRALWTSGGVVVLPNASFSAGPVVESDGQGGCLVGCYGGGTYQLQRFGPSGSPLWGPDGVSPAPGYASYLRLLADGTGGCFAVWSDYRSAQFDIFAQRYSPSGVALWAAGGVPVCTATGEQYVHDVVTDGRGGAVAVWSDYRVVNADLYVQRLDGLGNRLWVTNGVTAASFAASRTFTSRAVPDGEGGVLLAWCEVRGQYDIWTQRISGTGGRMWGTDGRKLCASSAFRQGVTATTDGVGGAILVWNDFRAPGPTAIYVQRVAADGSPQWASDGVPVAAPGTGFVREPSIVADGQGGARLAWRDARANPVVRMHAARVDASGSIGWASGGVSLGLAGFETVPPALALSERGAIAVWFTDRGNGYDVYGQRVDAYGNLGAPEPRITGVTDVPNDQGGRVRLAWNASWLDPDPSAQVNYYTVLRSVPAATALRRLAAGERAVAADRDAPVDGALWTITHGVQDFYWESIGSVSALRFVSGYSFLAPTTGDSVGSGNPRTSFLVVAQNYSGQYWLSAPDSGYSVDDLAPAPPAPFTGNYGFGTMRLHWDPNAESDLSGYRLYRGTSPGFVPGPGNLIATPADTGYADVAYARYHYKLTAVDVHGNESPVATFSPGGTVGVEDEPSPSALAFAAPSPNPARGATTLRFTLTSAGPATLEVYDASGRRVRRLRAGDAAAGAHATTFDLRDDQGRALPPGLYLARLDAGGRALTRRFVIAH